MHSQRACVAAVGAQKRWWRRHWHWDWDWDWDWHWCRWLTLRQTWRRNVCKRATGGTVVAVVHFLVTVVVFVARQLDVVVHVVTAVNAETHRVVDQIVVAEQHEVVGGLATHCADGGCIHTCRPMPATQQPDDDNREDATGSSNNNARRQMDRKTHATQPQRKKHKEHTTRDDKWEEEAGVAAPTTHIEKSEEGEETAVIQGIKTQYGVNRVETRPNIAQTAAGGCGLVPAAGGG